MKLNLDVYRGDLAGEKEGEQIRERMRAGGRG
jgi:hypothetical protein